MLQFRKKFELVTKKGPFSKSISLNDLVFSIYYRCQYLLHHWKILARLTSTVQVLSPSNNLWLWNALDDRFHEKKWKFINTATLCCGQIDFFLTRWPSGSLLAALAEIAKCALMTRFYSVNVVYRYREIIFLIEKKNSAGYLIIFGGKNISFFFSSMICTFSTIRVKRGIIVSLKKDFLRKKDFCVEVVVAVLSSSRKKSCTSHQSW